MTKAFSSLIVISLMWLLSGCGEVSSDSPDSAVLATINDYQLTLAEFQRQLEDELDTTYNLTPEGRKTFMEELIRKELLIQEAKRLQLDRKEKFIRTIERYWESTLIRDLIEIKCGEIDQNTTIPEDRISSRYADMKKLVSGSLPPFAEVKDDIARELKEAEKTRLLNQWIESLRETANIQIHPEVLKDEPAR